MVNTWWMCLPVRISLLWNQIFYPSCLIPWWDHTSRGRQERSHWWRLPTLHSGPTPTHEQMTPHQLHAHCRQCLNSQGHRHMWNGWGMQHAPAVPPCIFTQLQPDQACILHHQGVAACKPWPHQLRIRVWEQHSVQCVLGSHPLSHNDACKGVVQALWVQCTHLKCCSIYYVHEDTFALFHLCDLS